MLSATDTGTLLNPSNGALPPAVAHPANAATPPSGASRPVTAPAKPPRSRLRRVGSETSWMLGLDDRLLSSIVEKSLAMVFLGQWVD